MSEVTRTEVSPTGQPVVPVENALVDEVVARGWTIAVAESLTAGTIARRLCFCPGTEDRVLGGVVTYSTQAKRQVLGVKAERVVTAEAAAEMAAGVRQLFGADIGVGVTGVAGPDRQEDQPVGTVLVAWSTPVGDGGVRLACAGTPEQVRAEAAERVIALVLDAVREGEATHAG